MTAAIVPKMSRLEYELHVSGLRRDQLREWFATRRLDLENILDSHERQRAAVARVHKLLPQATIIERNRLNADALLGVDVVFALGGDNHFQYVAHFVQDETLLVGINSDPQSSVGYLLAYHADDLEVPDLDFDKLQDEAHVVRRMRALHAQGQLEALCDFYIGERRRTQISRIQLTTQGVSAEYKCSGGLLAGPLGWSGWYASATQHRENPYDDIPAHIAMKLTLTEVYSVRPPTVRSRFDMSRDQKVRLHYLSDEGLLAGDSLWEMPLSRGDAVTLSLDGRPLRAVLPETLPLHCAAFGS